MNDIFGAAIFLFLCLLIPFVLVGVLLLFCWFEGKKKPKSVEYDSYAEKGGGGPSFIPKIKRPF